MIITQAKRLENIQEYYFSKKLQEVAQLGSSGKPVINLGIGSPDMAPSAATIKALKASADSPFHHSYQPYKGIQLFRSAIADWSNKIYGTNLDENKEILPLLGSKEGIVHVSLAFLDRGDEVLVPNPGYPTYSSAAHLAGATIRSYELSESNGWKIDLEKLATQDLSKVKLMWVNYPHMPTGTKGDKDQFNKLIEFARKHQILLVNDNPYSLVLNDKPISLLAQKGAKDVALELNSLSKSHNMAGWRIGWLAGGEEYIATVLKVKSNMDSGMFLPLQLAAIKALENDEVWHRHRNQEYAERRVLVYQLLDELGCTYTKDQVGMFIWAKAPKGVGNVEEFVDEILYQQRIFITPGTVFGSAGAGFVRVSLCSSQSMLHEAINRLETSKKLLEGQAV